MQLPIVDFYTSEGETQTTEDVFLGKKTLLVCAVSAFNTTCNKMISAYEVAYDDFIEKGFDQVLCYVVESREVAEAWAGSRGEDNIKMRPDGDGACADSLHLFVNKHNRGLGGRAWRSVLAINEEGNLMGSTVEDGLRHLASTDPYVATTPKKTLEALEAAEARFLESLSLDERLDREGEVEVEEGVKVRKFK